MSWLGAAASYALGGTVGVGLYAYHRWAKASTPNPPRPERVQLPVVEEGTPIPLMFGRCRVRSPVLVWAGNGRGVAITGGWNYELDMLFMCGIPFNGGIHRIHFVYEGDSKLDGDGDLGFLDGFVGEIGGVENSARAISNGQGELGGHVEVLHGKPSQQPYHFTIVDRMTNLGAEGTEGDDVDIEDIPGFRGYLGIGMFNVATSLGHWKIGNSPEPGAYSFEGSTYPGTGKAFVGIGRVGVEANPADVIKEILCGTMGKLGISASYIDTASFTLAASVLAAEGAGFSRAFEDTTNSEEMIREVLEQIDGVIYEDFEADKIKIKLIRDDYDTSMLQHITPANCSEVHDYDPGSWQTVPNKIRVVYPNRTRDYIDDSETAINQANAVVRGEVEEIIVQAPGCCTAAQAARLAGRELAASSRPIARCSVTVDRSFYTAHIGMPVLLTWPEYGVSNLVFRVATVGRGTLDTRTITLDLIQDYFYVHRLRAPEPVGNGGFPPVLDDVMPAAQE